VTDDAGLAALGQRLLGQIDELTDTIVAQIREQIPVYRTELVPAEDQEKTVRTHLMFALSPLGLRNGELDTAEAHDLGGRRATLGVPLPAIMAAYRVGCRFVWQAIVDEAGRTGLVPDSTLVAVASDVWLMQDRFTEAMMSGYREELTARMLASEHERSALVGALIEGRLTDTAATWEAADVLRLSRQGPYVVVAAEVTTIGRQALPDVERRLAAAGTRSAWRLLPDLEVGLAELPAGPRAPAQLAKLISLLGDYPQTRIGVSPPYDDLQDTPHGLRYARIAMTGSRPGRDPVTVFDQAALTVTSVGAPDVMRRVARNVLAGLDPLPAADRTLLLDTLDAWLSQGGSADQAARQLFCHPNTVRHRLRRIEERTGRSLADPRDTAELCIALEAERRL
jgi:PucR C-terminal helix-turn-helix domain/GGDEF-like domain